MTIFATIVTHFFDIVLALPGTKLVFLGVIVVPSLVDDELGTPIFEDEEEEAAEGDAEATTRAVDPAASATSSDDDDGPDPTTSTSRGPIEQVTQPSPAAPEETPALVEEEATSTREAPRHIQRRHPP